MAVKDFPNPIELTPGEHLFPIVTPNIQLRSEIGNLLDKLKKSGEEAYYDGLKSRKTLIDWRPEWELKLKGTITDIAYSELPQTQEIWGILSINESTSGISKVSPAGKLLKTVQCNSELLSIWPARTKTQAEAFALLAGFKDDTLRAYSKDVKELWRAKAEIDPSFKIGDRYYAPWFTDPDPPYNKKGIYSILVDDIWGRGIEEIATGRTSTVEFRTIDGTLKRRVPTRWGDNTSLAKLPKKRIGNKEPVLIVGKKITGIPNLSSINAAYDNVSDNLFSRNMQGHTSLNAWMQRGLSHLEVNDMDSDGRDEVIYNLSGHWNELRVYNGISGKPIWFQYFGPDQQGNNFMRGLEILDLNGDGKSEVVVAMHNGWVCAFDQKGRQVWKYFFDTPITCMDSIEYSGKIVIGLNDGKVAMLDGDGHVVNTGNLQSAIQAIITVGDAVFAGTEKGVLAKFQIN